LSKLADWGPSTDKKEYQRPDLEEGRKGAKQKRNKLASDFPATLLSCQGETRNCRNQAFTLIDPDRPDSQSEGGFAKTTIANGSVARAIPATANQAIRPKPIFFRNSRVICLQQLCV
jgi:hypothetical protein